MSASPFSNQGLELVSCNGSTGYVGQRKDCKAKTRHITGYCFNHRHMAHRGFCPASLRQNATYSESGCTCGVYR